MRAACHANSRTQRLARKYINKKLGETASITENSGAGLLVFKSASSYYGQCDLD